MSRDFIPWLQAAHGLYHGLLLVAFVLQGRSGWRNRRDRLAGTPTDFTAVRRHRRRGPALALLLSAGYLAGMAVTVFDHGTWLRFAAHFATGTALVLLVFATAVSGARIRGRTSPWRGPHAALGSAAVALFFVQASLGLSILF